MRSGQRLMRVLRMTTGVVSLSTLAAVGGVVPAGAATAAPASAASAAAPEAVSAPVPAFTITPAALRLDPGAQATLTVQFAANRPPLSILSTGLPAGVSAVSRCPTRRVCTITLSAAASTPGSTATVRFDVVSGRFKRSANVALTVPGAVAVPGPVAAASTTTAVPPAAPAVAKQDFTMRTDRLVYTTEPGGAVPFLLELTRDKWLGPITLSLDGLPAGWSAAYSPNNVTPVATVTLVVKAGADAPSGDVPLKLVATSATATQSQLVVLRIQRPRLLVNVQTTPSIIPGTSGTFVLNVQSPDTAAGFTSIAIDGPGLPDGTTIQWSDNPVNDGLVRATMGVPAATVTGDYSFTFVATKGALVTRTSAVLRVVTPGTAFIATVSGPATGTTGYSLSATSSGSTWARGSTASIDVAVNAAGGFNAPVSFYLEGSPTWVVSWSVPSANVVRASISVPVGDAPKAWPVTIRAISGVYSASVTVDVTVV